MCCILQFLYFGLASLVVWIHQHGDYVPLREQFREKTELLEIPF